MRVLRVAVEALGADYFQWRGLVGPLIRVGFRTSQSTAQITQQGKKPRLVSWLMKLMMGVMGLFMALIAAFLPELFLLSLLVVTATALVVFFLLLANFQAVAVSPSDYQVLGYRPVSPRTYLLTRLAVTLAHQGIVAGLLAGPAMVVCGFRFGLICAIVLALAVAMTVLGITLALISIYGSIIRRVGARRLTRALSYIQLSLAGIYLIPLLLMERLEPSLEGLRELAPEGWMLALPTVWFASIASLAGGGAGMSEWLAAALAFASLGVLGWIARDKLSLVSAQQLGQVLENQAQSDSEQKHSGGKGELLGRLSVAARLIRGQFRHDIRFRMAALGMFPLLVIYVAMLIRAPGIVDPFVGGARTFPLFGVHVAVLVAPVIFLEHLYASESYRAGWIFYAAPVDRARLAGDARHCVTLFFFVPFLALAGICLAWLFEAVWHALAHLFLLGCLGMLGMQVSQFLAPRLPFALPVKRTNVLASVLVFAVAGLGAAVGPYTVFAYARPGWAIGTFVGVVGVVVLMELLLPGRLSRRLRWLESEG